MAVPDESWLALGALTETDLPSEWPPIMQIILNRSRSRSKSVFEVVTQPWQLSAFNRWESLSPAARLRSENEIFEKATQIKNASPQQVTLSRLCAAAMLELPAACGIIAPAVELYWSPRSMQPAYSLPPWDWSRVRCFLYPGIAASRFVFGEEVDPAAPGAGNVHSVAPPVTSSITHV